MTAAVVATTGYHEETADTTTHNVTVPASIAAGDLLILFSVIDGVPTQPSISGWQNLLYLNSSGSSITIMIYYKFASGSESDFTYTSSSSEKSVNECWRITGAHANHPPEITTGGENGTGATTFNPPSITPTWGSSDNLYIAMIATDGSITVTGYSADMTDNHFNDDSGSTTSGAGIALESVAETSSSHDPGSGTLSASTTRVSRTLAIRPATSPGPSIILRGTPLHSTTGGATVTMTDNGTPYPNRLLIALCCSTGLDSSTPAGSFTGYNVTWSQVGLYLWNNSRGTEIFAAFSGASPDSTDPVWTPGETSTGAHIVMLEAGLATYASSPVLCFRPQSAGTYHIGATGTGTTGTVNIAAAANTNNRPISMFEHAANELHTPRANWVELNENGFGSPNSAAEVQIRLDAFEATSTATWTTSSVWGGVTLELIDDAARKRTITRFNSSSRAAVERSYRW